MNDNNYFTTINEIEGEIASLKVTLKMTNDLKRKQELDRDINASQNIMFEGLTLHYKNLLKNNKVIFN